MVVGGRLVLGFAGFLVFCGFVGDGCSVVCVVFRGWCCEYGLAVAFDG